MAYKGRAARTGNSRGFRFESALFASHPEFASGDVEADVIAPGRLLIRTREERGAEPEDPVLDAFLEFLAEQMRRSPERITGLTALAVEGLEGLLEGVDYDPKEALGESFELP